MFSRWNKIWIRNKYGNDGTQQTGSQSTLAHNSSVTGGKKCTIIIRIRIIKTRAFKSNRDGLSSLAQVTTSAETNKQTNTGNREAQPRIPEKIKKKLKYNQKNMDYFVRTQYIHTTWRDSTLSLVIQFSFSFFFFSSFYSLAFVHYI